MPPELKVAIVGGGLLGRLTAWRLRSGGALVSLFERGAPDGGSAAGRIAAGMLAPWSERSSMPCSVFNLGRQALRDWPPLLDALHRDSGARVPMRTGGTVLVAHRQDEVRLAHLERAVRRHVGEDSAVQRLDGAGLAQLEPELAERFNHGLWMQAEASIASRALFDALLTALQRMGATLKFHTAVNALGPGWLRAGQRHRFDWVIDCRGFGARDDLPGLRGVRGEVIRVRAPEVGITRPIRLLHPRYPLYVVPRQDGRFVVGATEIESENRGRTTVRSALELLSALFSLHSGFAEAEIESFQANLRPAFDDHRPRLQVEDGLVRMNGLYRHGYLLAPAMTCRVAAVLLRGERAEADLYTADRGDHEDHREREAG